MIDLSNISPQAFSSKYILHHFPDQYEEIINYPIGKTFSEKFYLWNHQLNEVPKCPMCGKILKYRSIVIGYSKYCSTKCAANDPKTKAQVKKTKFERYGDETFSNREKAIRTCIGKYGVENPFQSEEIKEKIKKGYNEKYGVDYPSQSQEIQNTRKANSLKKYGVDHHMKDEKIRKKITRIIRDHYINNDPDLLGYDEDGNRIMKCPHPGCDKCETKVYVINPKNIFPRRQFNIEPCTNILPIKLGRNKDTIIERFVKRILDKHNISYIENPRSLLDGHHEIDIYIPDHNIAIECNGMFWHSTRNKSRTFHYDKYKQCLDKGIQLLTIWEDQIKHQSDIVRSIILSKLGIYKETVYARKCEIREVEYKEASEFLEENHLQGKTNFSVGLGLYYKDELVSLMTFSKRSKLSGSKNNDGEWDLNRFCNRVNISIIGGASKLLKYFIKHYKDKLNINTIISFASNDISNGDLYKKLGFLEKSHTLSYWYVHKLELTRYHRTLFTKSRLKKMGYDPTKTEAEIMAGLPYYKFYDCGHTKYVLNV